MFQKNLWPSEMCRFCLLSPELSPLHVWSCPLDELASLRHSFLGRLEVWLSTTTSPWLTSTFTAILSNVPTSLTPSSTLEQSCHHDLLSFGWQRLVQGFLPYSLVVYQDTLFQGEFSHSSGKKWVSLLIGKLLVFSHSLWKERCDVIHTRAEHGWYVEDLLDLRNRVRLA